MLFFPNATICVAEEATEKNKEGTKIKKYDFENPLEEFPADVQPNTLTRAQIELYGINVKTADTKKCFCDKESGNFMKVGNRAKVVYKDGTEKTYSVQPVNEWRFHKEFLLIPVENENG